jgi:diguanylate cyclase (GGDEF)-like protein
MGTEVPTLESVDMVCLVLGPAGDIAWANASGKRLGQAGGQAQPIEARIEAWADPGSRPLIRSMLEEVIKHGRSEGTVQMGRTPAVANRYYQLVMRRTEGADAAGRPRATPGPGIVVQGWDVTALVQRQQELEVRAFRDSLTGVSSRWAFISRLELELERSRGTGDRVALLFADVDRFKQVNDSFGHEAGDCVLARIGSRFQAALRPGDTVGRLGGDEFAVICPASTGWTAVSSVMNRLRAAAAEPIALATGVVEVTVSIGAAFADEVDLEAAALMAQADARMFRAKTARR